jgi:2-polyprenyl-6-methoxyphenol hydroxylase-like FAD-dependent oxidoreductase
MPEMIDALVVGAGPVGLLVAAELARHGIQPTLIERSLTRSPYSKALAVHMRTMEVFDALGILPTALHMGRAVHRMSAYSNGKRLFHLDLDGATKATAHPFVLILPQYETERLLTAHADLLGVTVQRELTLTALSQGDDAVTATVTDASGHSRELRARWLIACDGAHSAARRLLGVPYEGEDLDSRFLLADLTLSGDLSSDEMHTFLSADGLVALLPLPEEGRWRVIADQPAGEAPVEPTLALFHDILQQRTTINAVVSDATWLSAFSVRQRKASSYRHGRVLLAGDAAHSHSPIGGQGMNTGLQDAFNLAWKLALVIKGAASEGLLSSYDAEREPIAAALLKGTARGTRLLTLRGALSQAVRNTLVSIATSLDTVQQRIIRTLGELDIHYRDSPIVGEDRSSVLFAPLTSDPNSEQASLSQWRDFTAAPHPGDRAPDVDGLGLDGATIRLAGVTRAPLHTLLLFDGRASTAEGYQTLTDIADEVSDRYKGLAQVFIVVPMAEPPPALNDWAGGVLLDPQGKLHDAYGAGAECLYLIRPDGYVGYRAQPAERLPLLTFMHHHVFTALPLPEGVEPPKSLDAFSIPLPPIQMS